MKRTIYIIAFTFLGILLQFLVHGLVEIWYIGFLLKDFSTYGLGFSWEQWFLIHGISSIVLFLGGAAFGYWQGRYWWRRIYEEHSIRKFFFGP